MSTFGQIPNNITLGANQSIRRNAADNGFEAYTPGGGGGGAVDSVNGQTGVVVLTTDNIGEGSTNKYVTSAEKTKLANLSGTNTGDQDLSGLALKSTTLTINGTTQDLSANRTFTVTDSNLTTSDITTNDVSNTKHGFAPKLPGNTTTFLRGDGTRATPAGGGGGSAFYETNIDGQLFTGTIAQYVVTSSQTLSGVYASLLSLPTGSDVTIDVRKNGTAVTNSIFASDTPLTITTSQGLTNGVYSVLKTTIDNGSLVAGDVLYIMVTGVGSTLPGTSLYVKAY